MTLINDEDLLYTKDELAFRELARAFVEREIESIAKKLETEVPYPEEGWRGLVQKMGKEGFTGIMIPGAFGGKYFYEGLSYMKYRHFPS